MAHVGRAFQPGAASLRPWRPAAEEAWHQDWGTTQAAPAQRQTAKAAAPQAGSLVVSTTDSSLHADVPRLIGKYTEKGRHHGRPYYQKTGEKTNVLLYYFDESLGDSFNGWWFGSALGGEEVWSFAKSHAEKPPPVGWRIPWDAPKATTGALRISSAAQQAAAAPANKAAAAAPGKGKIPAAATTSKGSAAAAGAKGSAAAPAPVGSAAAAGSKGWAAEAGAKGWAAEAGSKGWAAEAGSKGSAAAAGAKGSAAAAGAKGSAAAPGKAPASGKGAAAVAKPVAKATVEVSAAAKASYSRLKNVNVAVAHVSEGGGKAKVIRYGGAARQEKRETEQWSDSMNGDTEPAGEDEVQRPGGAGPAPPARPPPSHLTTAKAAGKWGPKAAGSVARAAQGSGPSGPTAKAQLRPTQPSWPPSASAPGAGAALPVGPSRPLRVPGLERPVVTATDEDEIPAGKDKAVDFRRRLEFRAALAVRKVIQRLRATDAKTVQGVASELALQYAGHARAMGSQAEKVAEEAELAMCDAALAAGAELQWLDALPLSAARIMAPPAMKGSVSTVSDAESGDAGPAMKGSVGALGLKSAAAEMERLRTQEQSGGMSNRAAKKLRHMEMKFGSGEGASADERMQELKRKREEDAATRAEHQAAIKVRKVMQRAKVAPVDQVADMDVALQTVLDEQREALGSLVEKVTEEVNDTIVQIYNKFDQE